ncbi:uncharacterized protein MKZ38_007841 [Zalerion maritima]|uniref:TNT domain-containing protein n=1 Tax=Zalerion maritima TaxID=339359 RepID=A0AAD5WNX4_9PEZI|nr:uncharacterized protein MKZ38_007841 [Zalerion maritima]
MRSLSLLSVAAGLLLSAVIAAPARHHDYDQDENDDCITPDPLPCTDPESPSYCVGTNGNDTLMDTYICGDWRLGPIKLPTDITLDALVEIYDRFGGACPGEFLATWYNDTADSYMYPEEDGFLLTINGSRIEGVIELPEGTLIDRFGSEYGSYASPAAAPYMQRALPPSNLATPADDPRYPYNYHIYRVAKAFTVLSGPIAPWFGQPGHGVQYKLNDNIMTLLDGGYLGTVDLSALDDPEEPN